MTLSDLNPFLRYAAIQPWVLSDIPFRRAYDYRIFYILEGAARFVLTDKKFSIGPGTLLYFRPGVPYGFEGRVKGIVLNFDMTRAHSDKTEPRGPLQSLKNFDPTLIFENDPPSELQECIVLKNAFDIEDRLRECLYHFSYPSPCSEALSSAILKEILCYLVQETEEKVDDAAELVGKIALFFQQNYDRPLQNKDISAAFGYHSFYLNRIYKKHTGMTLHQAFLREKLRVAKGLLRGTSLSVAEVAAECGFAERSQFCTLFRKHTGVSPGQYRTLQKTQIK
ncbi:MAG: AraC family transcriptional regulator [Clostridia bacterium]|nr:AraC family transcriptional regulator [Clostridia bacterium]